MSDNINVSYKYDENGVRTQKNVNGITTDFITSGIKVLAQKSGENAIERNLPNYMVNPLGEL